MHGTRVLLRRDQVREMRAFTRLAAYGHGIRLCSIRGVPPPFTRSCQIYLPNYLCTAIAVSVSENFHGFAAAPCASELIILQWERESRKRAMLIHFVNVPEAFGSLCHRHWRGGRLGHVHHNCTLCIIVHLNRPAVPNKPKYVP